jgi:hypothetical protein
MAPAMKTQLLSYLGDKKHTGGRQLYNIKVKLAQADSSAKMFLEIDAKNRIVGLAFNVAGNEIDFNADVPGPDPSVRVKFDLMLTAYVSCNGGNPLSVTSATVSFSNVNIDGDTWFSIDSFLVNLFTGNDPVVTAQKAIEAGQVDITGKLNAAIGAINALLTGYLRNPLVIPSYDASAQRLVLSLLNKPLSNLNAQQKTK